MRETGHVLGLCNTKIMTQEHTQKAKLIGFSAAAVLLGMGFAAAAGTYAFGGLDVERGLSDDDREKVEEALSANDYEAFVTAMKEARQHTPAIPEERFNEMVARHKERAELDTILTKGDYDAWVAYMNSRPKITDYVTKEEFPQYIKMHEALQSGDRQTAEDLRDEIGIPHHRRGARGGGMSFGEHDICSMN